MKLFSWMASLFEPKTKKNNVHALSEKAFGLILKYEISSQTYYNRFLKHPTWPKASSGVTIGIGYDLGYQTKEGFLKDWGDLLSKKDLERLSKTIRFTGENAKGIVSSVEDIEISWDQAIKVFNQTTVPKFIELTKKAFPESEKLHPDAFGALVSIVFNRGSSMSGPRRDEMRKIRALVPKKDYKGIAEQIRHMKRLWVNKGVDGLLERREAEAKLVESCY